MASPLTRLRELEIATRPEHPDLAAALARRWAELPAHVKQPSQMLGKRMTGCEGNARRVPEARPRLHPRLPPAIQAHRASASTATTRSARSTRRWLCCGRERGPGQHAQLIGGEVTLLGPEDHARALRAMIRHGRKPMSMTHGDFDYDYLEALALDPRTGEPRFDHLAFAGHFDSMMFGRRGIKRVKLESELNPYRERFCEMFPAVGARAGRHALPRAQHHRDAAQH